MGIGQCLTIIVRKVCLQLQLALPFLMFPFADIAAAQHSLDVAIGWFAVCITHLLSVALLTTHVAGSYLPRTLPNVYE